MEMDLKTNIAQFAINPVEKKVRYELDEPWTWRDWVLVTAIGVVLVGIGVAANALYANAMGV
jgi:hypothetical protein